MNKNWHPTYPDGKEILISEKAYRDSWLLDRFSATHLIDRPDRIRDMNVRMCELWLDHYNRLSILPKKKKSDPSISIKETKVAVRERMNLIKTTRSTFKVKRKKRKLLEQYCGELNNLCDTIEAYPGDKDIELEVHGSKNRSTLYDFAATPTGLYSEAAYKALLLNPKTRVTEEHFFPRTLFAARLGAEMVERRLADPSFRVTPEEIFLSVYASSMVSIVLPHENESLIKYQKSDFDSPAQTYRAANIRVVDTGKGTIHHSWFYMAEVFGKHITAPSISDFDYDNTGLYVTESEIKASIDDSANIPEHAV